MKFVQKNKMGVSLPFTLGIISFVSAMSFSAYKMTEEQSLMTNESNMRDLTYQAAENSIQEVLDEYNIGTQDGLETLNSVDETPVVRCLRKDGVVELDEEFENCDESITYDSDEVISQSTTTRVDSQCLTWGNSDKSIKCYQIVGMGNLANTNILNENIQEVQIVEIKQEDNGIYEF